MALPDPQVSWLPFRKRRPLSRAGKGLPPSLAAARGTDCDPSLPRRRSTVPPCPAAPPPPPERTRAAGFGAAGGRANAGDVVALALF